MSNTFAIALKYHTLGRCVIPSGGGSDGKAALIRWKRHQTELPTDEQIENWQRELNPTIWAMVTGQVSNCFVIDRDTPQAIAMMEAARLKPHIKTTKGCHYYCQLPSWTIPTKVGILPGIDIRGQGGYVNFCGKNDKVAYEVLIMPTDQSLITFEQLPAELQEALKPKPKALTERILREALDKAQPGNRNDTGLWLACQLRDNGVSQAEAESIIQNYAIQVGDTGSEPYTEKEALASLEQAYKQPAREPWHVAQPLLETTLPEIRVSGRHLRDMTADALEALYKANQPERIFRRGGMLVRISLDEKRRPSIEALNADSFRGYLTRSANYKRVTQIKNEWVETRVTPPIEVVKDCLSLGEWRFPALTSITEVPVLRPDGTVLTEAGYDKATKLYYYRLPDLVMPAMPDKPSSDEVKAATDLALEPLVDFPFDNEASRANGIATMIAPVLRPLIDSPLPLAIFDKPQAGTGASLLAEVINLINTGRPAAMMPPPRNEEEWSKVITVQVIKGRSVMVIDNIEYKLQSPSLSALLTSKTWNGRILGRSDDVIFPNIIMPIATGNNIQLGGDLPRRCVWVRMDAKIAQPWLRPEDSFKHSNLTKWVSENRGAILRAILTVARAWVVAGMPEAKGLPHLGTYESYCRIVGGVLAFMGIDGFLSNLSTMYSEMDIETQQWEAFLVAWLEYVGEKAATTAEVDKILNEYEGFRNFLPDKLAEKDTRDYSRRLGNALSKRKDIRHPNGLMVKQAENPKSPALAWKVVNYLETANLELLHTNTKLAKLSLLSSCSESNNNKVYKEQLAPNLDNLELGIKTTKLAKSEEVFFEDTVDIEAFNRLPCSTCGTKEFWKRVTGEQVCSLCHPEPRRENDSDD